MSGRHDRDEDLRSRLRETHRVLDPPAPDFDLLWSRARASHRKDRRSRPALHRILPGGPALAAGASAAGLLAAVLALALLLPATRQEGPGGMTPQEALALAEDLSGWASPLEFLDRAPGQELYDSFPRLYPLPGDLDELLEAGDPDPPVPGEGLEAPFAPVTLTLPVPLSVRV